MHVLISIDDQKHGNPEVKTLSHPVIVGDDAPRTPAVELGEFLMLISKVWLEAGKQGQTQVKEYLINCTGPSAVKH